MKTLRIVYGEIPVPGNGDYNGLTVPGDRWWEVLFYRVSRASGANYQFDQLMIFDGSLAQYVSLFSATNGPVVFEPRKQLLLPPNWSLRFHVITFVAAGVAINVATVFEWSLKDKGPDTGFGLISDTVLPLHFPPSPPPPGMMRQ